MKKTRPLPTLAIVERPTHARNYLGEQELIKWPAGEVIAHCGSVWLLAKGGTFAVVYGLDVKVDLSHREAAQSFGFCVLHEAECNSLIA